MTIKSGETYPFTFEAVRGKVPQESGVYGLYTAGQWVYIGESDDIRQRLFRHLNEPSASMNRFGPLSFSFETAGSADRVPLQHALICELDPACTEEDMAMT
jgi:hypothetical protein